jgi:hypothetical protein
MCQLEPGIEVWAYTCDSRCSQGWTHSGTDRPPHRRIWNKPREYGELFVERTLEIQRFAGREN